MATYGVHRGSISYKKLDTSKQEFRLLEIRPAASVEDRIEARLVTVRLKDEPEFIALSSLYGSPSESENVIVNGRPITITLHLAQALRHIRTVLFPGSARNGDERLPPKRQQRRPPFWLRQLMKGVSSILPNPEAEKDVPLRVWLDVICVNQYDEVERSRQVQDMRQIYTAAQMTVGWLGMKTEHTEAGLEILIDIDRCMPPRWGDPGDREEHPENYSPKHAWFQKVDYIWKDVEANTESQLPSCWQGSNDLMNRPYFARRWILEEIARARYPAFLVGDTILSWRTILRLHRMLEEVKYADSENFPKKHQHLVPTLPIEAVQALLDDFARRSAMEDTQALDNSTSSQEGKSATSSLH
ncbi:hypothetical protein PFICI_02780 [Pestalotiopsis fici W106-1]|uniref:Heterokaryon incompatibility domain-containing protein n=1 Tax=Pestalotiopsis fici (strain W106-1 / CGMCC3.15140) TaxID=1229662 RepID=W3XFF5_PESFW|nr:uncharacterized protein PFICI_02780 [Pestalotiopsis fici W106-1]ETS84755.1 hypothetical protein PFICI_02780 [Pestalotiopsis fici W106-1]